MPIRGSTGRSHGRFAAGATALLAIALVWAVPAALGEAPPATATFRAVDFRWQANGGSGNIVYVAPGGTVLFDYPSGASLHNANFGSGPPPTSCTQTGGNVSGDVPPLPHVPTGPDWSGNCTFATPQTHSFFCDAHPGMTGTIVVTDTLPADAPPGSTAPSGPTESPPETTNSLAGDAVKLPRRQRGVRVRGSVLVSVPKSDLAVNVYTSASALTAGASRARLVRVGRIAKRSLDAERAAFSVKLSARARRALGNGRKLRLTVRLALTSPGGDRANTTRRMSLAAR